MKKLLFLLLLPLVTVGQDMLMDHSIVQSPPYAVGDTITVKFNPNIQQATPTLIQFDYQYNNKLLQKVDHTFKVNSNGTNTAAQTSLNHWDGYSWVPAASIAADSLSAQYGVWNQANGSVYNADADWSVERITVQDAITIGTDTNTVVEVRFIVKDKAGTNYSDWSAVTQLNWARAVDNSTSTSYSIFGSTMNLDLGQVSGGQLSAITLKLNTANSANFTDYSYNVYSDLTGNDYNNDGIIDNYYPSQNATPILSGVFDAAGEAILTGLTDGVRYYTGIYVATTYDQNTSTYGPAWLDDVVTVTDVYLLFQYASATDINGTAAGQFSYDLQKILGNADQQTSGVDLQDSYTMLSYLAGNLDGQTFHPISSTLYGAMNYSARGGTYGVMGPLDGTFIPNPNTTQINYYHALGGDIDLSHSATPPANQVNNSITKKAGTATLTSMALKTPETSNLDITSELVGGKVVVTINTVKEGMIGNQINLKYDSDILTFDEVIFDTGNTMTNFANNKTGKIFIGALDLNGGATVKTGTPYKVIFTPKKTITNTAGLVSFGVTEGVKADGTKVKFNIK